MSLRKLASFARMAPTVTQAGELWGRMRHESNVDIGNISLAGAATRRHVVVDGCVDGVSTGALSVMSQGELHALALAMFIPRATNPESPFRFLVLDDPIQAMDPAKIAALQQDTERVSALLANIFTEAEDTVTTPAVAQREPDAEAELEPSSSSAGLLGLDEAHSALARMMLSRPEWSREELLDVAADLDLMLDGALERINEAAFDAHDMPLCEGDEPVVVNAEILEKVEA